MSTPRVRNAATPVAALEPRLDRSGDCWIWLGGVKKGSGYGSFNVAGKNYAPHRVAYEEWVGTIPDGGRVTQTCGERLCCKPDHLRLKQPGTCYECGEPATPNRTGLCKVHQTEYERAWRASNKESTRAAQIRYRYGVEAVSIDAMLAEQGGLCAICRTNPATHIDHCHDSGSVRGILCPPCNKGLGHFEDNEERLMAAVAYLLAARGDEGDD